MRITRHLTIGLGALALSACAGLPETALAPPPMEAGFAANRAVPRAPEIRSGYVLAGADFDGELVFEDSGGVPGAALRHSVRGADPLYAELSFDEPFLDGGVHAFSGETATGLPVDLVLEHGPCRSGGRDWGYFATLHAGRLRYEGCAGETGPVLRWTNDLAHFLPAVEACQAHARTSALMHFAGSGRREIVHVRREGDADVVRYAFPGSGRFDCRLRAGQVQWRPVNADSPVEPGEGDPVFLPGHMPEAGDDCRLYARVRDGEGGLIGSLGYDVCTAVGAAEPPARFG